MNVLSYHPDTFKTPKKLKEYSLLTANQASSLVDKAMSVHYSKQHTTSPHATSRLHIDNEGENMYEDSRGFLTSKIMRSDKRFRSTMQTINEDKIKTNRPFTGTFNTKSMKSLVDSY